MAPPAHPDPVEAFFDANSNESRQWRYYAVHTKSRREKQLRDSLLVLGNACYLPTYCVDKERRAGGGRVRKYRSELVLFPGYVFASAPAGIKSYPMVAEKAAHWIEVSGVEVGPFLQSLQAIRSALSLQISLTPYEGLQPGKRVRLAAGPLRGTEGKIVEHRGKLLFAVEIEFLGRGVMMEVEAPDLRPVD